MSGIPDRERATLAAHDAQRARRLWMLEFGSRNEFNDPSLAYRRLFAELLGTFMLALVAAGGGVLHNDATLAARAAALGVDAITTDRPAALRHELAARSLAA